MAFDAGNIFQTYMQGANFVAGSLERAENRRRQQEEDELQSIAGKGLEIFAPKYDKDGKLLPRTSGDIFNDPKTLELANHPYMKSARMQGITDPRVKDVRYVGGSPLEDGKHVVPIVEQLDEDGTVISRGPLTEGRSRDGNAAVMPITVDTMFNHLAGEVYRRNPRLGAKLLSVAQRQALGGLQTQYRNAQSDAEREQLVQIWSSYGGTPEDLMKNSGAPIVQQDLRTGFKQVKDAAGNISYQRDPETAGLRGEVVAQDQKEDLAKRKAAQEQDFQVEGEQRPTREAWRTGSIEQDAATKQKLADLYQERELAREGKARRTLAEVDNEIANLYAPDADKRAASHTGAVADATAGAGLRNAPTTVATHRITNPNQIPAEQEAANLIDARQIIKDVPGLLAGGPAASSQQIARLAPALPQAERNGLRAELMKYGPAARDALAALDIVDGGLRGGGKGEAPKPAEYNATGIDKWTADMPEEEKRKVRLEGEQTFRDLMQVYPATKGSQEEANAQIAVAEALRLGRKGQAFPLINWAELQRNPEYAAGLGSSEEFLDQVHVPIVEEVKRLGIDASPQKLSGIERMAVGLKARGIPYSDAVMTSVDLEKEKARVDKIVRLLPAGEGVSNAEREKVFLDILASDLKKDRTANAKRTLREGADYTFGGGMWR